MSDDKKIIQLPSQESIESMAATWMARLGRDDFSADERSEFELWLSASDRHKDAYDRLQAMWGDLSALDALSDIGVATLKENTQNVFTFPRRKFMQIAATVAAASVGGVAYLAFNGHFGVQRQAETIATKIGEQRGIKLVDGSTIELNTNSKVVINIDRGVRRITLLQGEAHFDVAKDAKRPFVVSVHNKIVRAIGTAFTVRLRSADLVEVTVEEGRVQLGAQTLLGNINPAQPEDIAPLAELSAGQNAVFQERVETIAQLPQSEVKRKLSWRQGLLAYAGDPLSDVVADISRYTAMEIEIADPAIEEIPIGGYFRLGEVDALLDALEGTFGLHVERIDENHVRLSAVQ